MAKRSSRRWRDWRVDEGGKSIRSKLGKRRQRKRGQTKGAKKSASGWWWTRTKFPGKCHGCGLGYGEGDIICFRSKPKTVYCQTCAEGEGAAAEAQLSKSMSGRLPRVVRKPAVPALAPAEDPCGVEYHGGGSCELEKGHQEELHELRTAIGIYRWR